MRVLSCLLAVTLLLSGCSGLPYPREMEDMALLRTMGVDQTEDALLVTVSTGPRARGLKGDREPALLLSTKRPSLSAAVLALQGLSDSYVFFGYVDQLLLGEELSHRGITSVLDYFARDVELGLGAQLWIVRGTTAHEAVKSGGEQGVDSRLTTLQTDGEMRVAAISRTAGEVYSDLLEQGASYAPALLLGGQEGVVLTEGGYAILKGDVLAGFLEGDEARGLELLEGKPSADVLEVDLPSGRVTVRVEEAATFCRLRPGGEGLSITCRITALLVEYRQPLTQKEYDLLQEQVRTKEETRILKALAQLRSWGADCAGLGFQAALTAPREWSAIKENWAMTFAQKKPVLTVQVELHE